MTRVAVRAAREMIQVPKTNVKITIATIAKSVMTMSFPKIISIDYHIHSTAVR